MKQPPDGWDTDEQDVPAELSDALSRLDPRRPALPLEVLRAAGHDVLPPDLEQAAQRYLARHAQTRALIGDLDAAASLDPEAGAQLLERMTTAAQAATRNDRSWRQPLQMAAAIGALAIASSVWWAISRQQTGGTTSVPAPPAITQTPPATAAAPAPAPPTFLLPLERPDVRISLRAMTWRGADRENPALVALKPALDAFRTGDYAAADREFSSIAPTFPDLIEIPLYQGVARLFVGDVAGAKARLDDAEAFADPAFANDVAWYLAIADERAGNREAARDRITALCARGAGDPRACAVSFR